MPSTLAAKKATMPQLTAGQKVDIKLELREETGYAAEEWHALGSSTANTARQNNRVHAFLALDARKVAEPEFDAGEIISTHLVPWERFLADLADGTLDFPDEVLARQVNFGLWYDFRNPAPWTVPGCA